MPVRVCHDRAEYQLAKCGLHAGAFHQAAIERLRQEADDAKFQQFEIGARLFRRADVCGGKSADGAREGRHENDTDRDQDEQFVDDARNDAAAENGFSGGLALRVARFGRCVRRHGNGG